MAHLATPLRHQAYSPLNALVLALFPDTQTSSFLSSFVLSVKHPRPPDLKQHRHLYSTLFPCAAVFFSFTPVSHSMYLLLLCIICLFPVERKLPEGSGFVLFTLQSPAESMPGV